MNVDRAFPTSCLEGTSVAARESSKRRKLEVSKCKYAVLHLISSPPRHTHTHTHTPISLLPISHYSTGENEQSQEGDLVFHMLLKQT